MIATISKALPGFFAASDTPAASGASVISGRRDASTAGTAAESAHSAVLYTDGVCVSYGDHQALRDTSLAFDKGSITALIGPSGCGKSTYLRCLNLMNREIPGCTIEGEIYYRGSNINTPDVDLYELRRSIGMVFQQPNPFPKTIYENIAFAPRCHGERDRSVLDQLIEESLRGAALWDEVKDKLHKSALALSGGQQQRLCIARALALKPDVILLDEPCSALDPISTLAIEELMHGIAEGRAIIIVTHNMEQATRVSDRTAFFYMGEMIETGETTQIFNAPKSERLNDYLSGRFS
ncbi:phosphate ABC transporter ATP-binding protein PstB [Collinsella sp. AGMB00827]|uniref:Phosphate ABC transporter ATP-binding protein PstB n=1 Tax=Collinsella ureilytica TaxID=2869515 RepID=A0ABS7MLZ6_9ACTN|nr:phosphate ABC transporter ATP-binding protein PstB [Collinsella urealyticum]MBY4798386.1 phosphate ABC transporter ATP-binding protein PstB [Collinsella urealyticum]